VLVPCHRVLASDGALTGYKWGIERKRRLLRKEQARQPAQPGVIER
jgi:AraC family transcriptional regulator of adaptative response/methylated-DNA-[protein]-cysteine methyltransferase